jgi:hypothetical protein
MSADWSTISDAVEVPVHHGTDDRDEWSVRTFCQSIYAADIALDTDTILQRAAIFKAFDDPASRKFEGALHRELKSSRASKLEYSAFAELVDNVLDAVAEELLEGGEQEQGGQYRDELQKPVGDWAWNGNEWVPARAPYFQG